MWNDSVDEEIKNKEGSSDGEVKRQKVEARYRVGGHEEDTCTVDLLDMGGDGTATSPNASANCEPLDLFSQPVQQGNDRNTIPKGGTKSTTPGSSDNKASELLLDFKGSRDEEEKKTTKLVYDQEHDIMDDIDLL